MLPKNRILTHPGEALREEFLSPLGVTQVALAEHIGVSVQRVNEIVRGKRGVTPETAWLLAGAFGTTPEFWINMQALTTWRGPGRYGQSRNCRRRPDLKGRPPASLTSGGWCRSVPPTARCDRVSPGTSPRGR